jgi:hypothetical protein
VKVAQRNSIKKPSFSLAIIILIGLFLFSTSTLYPLSFLSVFDAKRILQLYLYLLIFIIALVYTPIRKSSIKRLACLPKFIAYPTALLFITGILSSLRLNNPAYALIDVSMLFLLIPLSFVIAASRDQAGITFDKISVSFIAFLGLAVAVQEFMGFLMGWVTGTEFSYELVLIHFANPRFYNHLQTMFVPLLVLLPFLFSNQRWIKPACYILLALQWFLIFSTGARGSFISLVAAMSFIAIWLPTSVKHWLKPQVLGLLFGALIYGMVALVNDVVISKPGNFFEQSVGRSMIHTSGRTRLWQYSFDDAISHPLLGAGPSRYACDIETPTMPMPAHPHSFPIRIMGEWGFLALLIVFGLGLTIGLKYLLHLRRFSFELSVSLRAKTQYESVLLPALAISIAASVIHACVSGVLIMPASQTAIILIAGWTLSANNPVIRDRSHQWIPGLMLLAGLLIATFLTWFATSELAMRQKQGASTEHITNRLTPRFWWIGRTCAVEHLNHAM